MTFFQTRSNKVMDLSAITYNLKKYLKFINKRAQSGIATSIFFESICFTFNFQIRP